MSLEVNPNLYPPGGYFFIDKNGFRHRGESWRDLERRVRHYREINRFSVGDVREEIMAQACSRNPNFCRESSKPTVVQRNPLSFNQRVIEWFVRKISLLRQGKLPRVDDAEAARRAKICLQCPNQQDYFQGCASCLQTIKTSRKALLRSESRHPGLKPCRALGEDCSISVHIEQEKVSAQGLPSECWRK